VVEVFDPDAALADTEWADHVGAVIRVGLQARRRHRVSSRDPVRILGPDLVDGIRGLARLFGALVQRRLVFLGLGNQQGASCDDLLKGFF